MNPLKIGRRTAGETVSGDGIAGPAKQPAKRGRKPAPEPKVYPNTEEGRMEAAADGVRASLEKYERGIADILDCDASLAALENEVNAYLAGIDPRDEKAVSIISIKRDQIRLLPIYKGREEVKQDERGAAFIVELEVAAKSVLACADLEINRALDVIETAIRPWFPPYVAAPDRLLGLHRRTLDPARQVAATSALCYYGLHTPLLGNGSWSPPAGGRLHGSESSVRSYDRALIDRGRQVLGIFQAWQENGRSFLRHTIPPAGPKPESTQESALPQSAVTTLPDAENAA